MKSFRVVIAVLAALVFAEPAAAQVYPDNTLIQVTGKDEVYRVVGRAPIWLSTCANDSANCPSNVKQITSLAGYQPYPDNGVTIRNADTGAVYRFAGGAPLWVGRCTYGPGCGAQYQVDSMSLIDLVRSHIRQYPADGTVIRNVDDGAFYRFAGGAPLVTRCDIGPGCADPPLLDKGTFENNGTNGVTPEHMRQLPPDGTTVYNLDDGTFWRFAGGAPLRLSGCDGCALVNVDNRTFQLAGTGTPAMPHMRSAPAEGTFLKAGSRYFRVAGSAALEIFDCSQVGNCAGAVTVDDGTIAINGGGYLLAKPKDGTVLRGQPSGQKWEIIGGKRRQTFANIAAVVDIDDGAIGAIPLDLTQVSVPVLTPAFTPLITGRYGLKSRRTRFTALSVRNLPTGAKVVITCKGKGCPYKKKTYTKFTKGRVDAIKPFRKARLRAKAVVTVTVTAANGERKITKWTMRATKLPKRSDTCAPAGTRLKRC